MPCIVVANVSQLMASSSSSTSSTLTALLVSMRPAATTRCTVSWLMPAAWHDMLTSTRGALGVSFNCAYAWRSCCLLGGVTACKPLACAASSAKYLQQHQQQPQTVENRSAEPILGVACNTMLQLRYGDGTLLHDEMMIAPY
eukprot:GHRQ01033236.1.p1 GENE.GHRQ01033236.1~~GHRQ01033236.1.p1  ORF type:complete len:151 (+),score=33.52 GHRQ01033236.1:29-454(+)